MDPWIKQRTRWMKGFMVTAVVHGRSLRSLANATGPFGFAASQIAIAGVAFAALAYPVVAAWMLYCGLTGTLFQFEGFAGAALAGVHAANLVLGYAAAVACAWMGVDRRNASAGAGSVDQARLTASLCFMPIYWFLVGAAAWRALWQVLFKDTSHWEKTQHGVSTRRETPGQQT